MASPKLHSVLKNETEFVVQLNTDSSQLNSIANAYIFLNEHYFCRDITGDLYEKKLVENVQGRHALNIASNRQIFEIIITLISGKDKKSLLGGYEKACILAKKLNSFELECKYNTKTISIAFNDLYRSIKTIDDNIEMKTAETVIAIKDDLRSNEKSTEELLSLCEASLKILLDVVLNEEEYSSNTDFKSRLQYVLSNKLYDQCDSSVGIILRDLCQLYSLLINENNKYEEPERLKGFEDPDILEGPERLEGFDDPDILEEPEGAPEIPDEPDSSEKDKSEKQIKAELKKLTGAHIKQTTNDLVATLCELYESGFSSLPHFGILCNNEQGTPLVKFKYEDGRPKMTYYSDEGTLFDSIIMDVLKVYAPEIGRYAPVKGDTDSVPPTAYLMENNSACHKLHLQFQSANIAFCTGRVSIRKWITETQLEKSGCINSDEWIKKVNQGKSVLKSFKFVKEWYRWCIENILIDNLYDYGIRPDNIYSEEVRDKIPVILAAVSRNLRNIAVISEREAGVKEEFRVSTDTKLSFENDIKPSLEKKLNIGNAQSVIVKQIDYKYGVLSFRVVYDINEENKSQLFAGDIVDNLISSGNTPSWSHALLGKKENGTYFFWDDFMDPSKATPEKRCYTIYAGSRSGKGVMTSTLVAAAMCDGKQVFYTDGKPENGAALGEIAWSRGKEAYVWNGTSKGKDPYSGQMEQYTSRVRTSDEIADYIHKLPKCLFENPKYFTNDDQAKFLALMRYLKSLSLCASVIEGRSDSSLPNNVWQIWVFDELTAMSRLEKEIRHIFFKYLSDREVKMNVSKDTSTGDMIFESFKTNSDEEKGKKGEESAPDEGVLYIRKWQDWTAGIINNILNASVISLGKASANLIFIFQEPSWLKTDETKTTICKIVRSLKSTKIAGNKAIPREAGNAAGEYGDASMKYKWIERINDGTGWWVISNGSNIKDGNVTLFKPYTVWTTPLASDGTKSNEPPSEDKKTRYLAGYIDKLLGAAGIDAADLLQSAYNYAENAIKTFKFADSLKEYMYDCSNLKMTNADSSYENLIKQLNDGSKPERGTNPNIPMSSINLENETGAVRRASEIEPEMGSESGPERGPESGPERGPESGDYTGASSKSAPSFLDRYSGKGSISRVPDIGNIKETGDDLFSDGGNSSHVSSKLDELTKNLLNAVNSKLAEKTDDSSERARYKEIYDTPDNGEFEKSLKEVSIVKQTESQGRPDYSLDGEGRPVYTENDSTRRYSEEASSKNSITSKFSIGKETLARKFASWRGIAIESSNLFRELLRELELRGVDFKAVTRVAISEDALFLNKRNVDLKGTCMNDTIMDLVDIVDFKYMFKKIPNIAHLGLDGEAMDKLYQYYCAGSAADYTVALTSAFSDLPKLVQIDYIDYSGRENVLRRDMLGSPEIVSKLNDLQESGVLTHKLRLAAYNKIGGLSNNKRLIAKTRSSIKSIGGKGMVTVPKTLLGVGVASGGLAMAGAVFGLPVVAISLAGLAINNLAKLGEEASKGSSKSGNYIEDKSDARKESKDKK